MSTVQFAGSLDGRRRRRLAQHADASSGHDPQSLGAGLPAWEASRLTAALPWVPRPFWKLWTAVGLLASLLAVVCVVLVQRPSFRPQIAPAFEPLFRSSRPPIAVFLETLSWLTAAHLAWLVGWHRALSRLDFRGRYRLWTWVALACLLAGFCTATGWHLALGKAVSATGWLPYRAELVGWMLPATLLLLPLWWFVDRDVRRSTSALTLVRISLLLLLTSSLLQYADTSLRWPRWLLQARPAIDLFAVAMIPAALWFQLWTVAFVTPDPWQPAAAVPGAASRWSMLWAVLGRVGRLLGRRTEAEEVVEPPKRKRKKVGEEATTSAPRKRKKAARKSTTRTRSRSRIADEDETGDGSETAADEATETEWGDDAGATEDDQDAGAGSSGDGQSDDESASDSGSDWNNASMRDDLSEEELERLTAPVASTDNSQEEFDSRGDSRSRRSGSQASHSRWQQDANESDDGYGGDQYRVDDQHDDEGGAPHGGGADPYKGLSKKQRRELKRQQRQG